MPFKSVKQELYMRKNTPKVWRDWVKRYGHHPGYTKAVKNIAKKIGKKGNKK